MKKLLLLSLLASSVAFADVSTGQKSVMVGTINGVAVTLERTVMEEVGNGMWAVLTVVTAEGKVTSNLKQERLYSTAEFEQFMAKCSEAGGKRENYTVKAGTFDSCVVESGETKFVLTDVPFNSSYLRVKSSEVEMILELESYKK